MTGTNLLVYGYRPEERFRVQSTNDFLVFTIQALESFSSGWLVVQWQWQGLQLACVPLLMLFMVMLARTEFCDIGPGKTIMSRMDAPVWALGLRPFYLLGAIFALVAVPVWLASYVGLLQSNGYLHGPAWHSHEMVFGFAAAVICGFLLTAVRNWTGQATLSGAGLAGLAALWIMARLTAVTGPAILAAIIDSTFFPALAIAFSRRAPP